MEVKKWLIKCFLCVFFVFYLWWLCSLCCHAVEPRGFRKFKMADAAQTQRVPLTGIGEFTGTDWGAWIDRLEFYYQAMDVTDADKKRAVLLSTVGEQTYNLVRSLSAPAKPGTKTFDQICEMLATHFEPQVNLTLQRYKFSSCNRKPEQTVTQFITELKDLSRLCDFGHTPPGVTLTAQMVLEDNLRDRLLCGVLEPNIQRRLLAEPGLTFARACDISISMELARESTAQLGSLPSSYKPKQINHIASKEKHKSGGTGNSQTGNSQKPCFRCSKTNHSPDNCRYKNAVCRFCKKKGHIESNCFGKKKRSEGQRATHHLEDDAYQSEQHCGDTYHNYSIYELSNCRDQALTTTLILNGARHVMEIDSGAAVSVISTQTYKSLWPKQLPELQPSMDRLRMYNQTVIPVDGIINISVETGTGAKQTLPLRVVKGSGPSLVGRDWLRQIKLDWHTVFTVKLAMSDTSGLQTLLQTHEKVFAETMKPVKNAKAQIYVEEGCRPKFFKARPTPYAMKDMIDSEIDRLLEQGIIKPVQYSDWAAPVVPVLKADQKTVRLCGDYSVTVNRIAKTDRYPIPKIEDLYAQLGNGSVFSKLDMRHAYEQIPLDEESQKYVTINTHRGLFAYQRLPYGVASAPGIFQRIIESLMKDIPKTMVYLDDILVAGSSHQEHLQTLELVLSRLEESGFCLKREKCEFLKSSVEYLGHKIDATGIHAAGKTLNAITRAPAPTNITELRSFLGMINHYGRFLPGLANTLAPFHHLLKKDVKWKWAKEEEKAFVEVKGLLSSPKLVVHYDPKKPLTLTTDASPYGVGAVLSHVMKDGAEKPVACFSRTLSPAEKNYSQLDKEALGIIAGLTKFRQYLWGRPFKIFTDHKPLVHIFNEKKAVPQMASPRMQRWALLLAAHQYEIVYKEGKSIPHADALSRLPDPTEEIPKTVPIPGDITYNIRMLDNTVVTSADIRQGTARDPVLAKVIRFVQEGFPDRNDEIDFRPYFSRKNELSIQDGCLLWGARVVVPPSGRTKLLSQLHDSHTGIVRMKAIARSVMWWPGIDNDIELAVKSCVACQTSRPMPPHAPLSPWCFPEKPWSRVHVDYAGPINGKMLFILTDAHSKWIDAFITNGCTSAITIAKLRHTFAIHGLPDMIVSDNGTAFTSAEFKDFCTQNGIKHVTSAPYHPSSNGCAERAVGIVKDGIKRMRGGDMEANLERFLFDYRITPQMTTGKTPSELLMNRKLKTRFDLIKPDLLATVRSQQMKQKFYHDKSVKERQFHAGDAVYTLYFRGNSSEWIPGTIKKATGPLSYIIQISDDRLVRRHIDQIRARVSETVKNHVEHRSETFIPPDLFQRLPASVPEVSVNPEPVVSDIPAITDTNNDKVLTTPSSGSPVKQAGDKLVDLPRPSEAAPKSATPRRSSRMRRAPTRLDI